MTGSARFTFSRGWAKLATVDWGLGYLERCIESIQNDVEKEGGSFELIPDFQRGHVWTIEQQSAFVESLIRGNVTSRILFNCPGWIHASKGGDIKEHTFQCIDGLQRLTAVRKFMKNEITIFNGLTSADLKGTPFDPIRPNYRLQVGIFEFDSRSDLLRFYLDLNTGGTVHSNEEIQRVQILLEEAQKNREGLVPIERPRHTESVR